MTHALQDGCFEMPPEMKMSPVSAVQAKAVAVPSASPATAMATPLKASPPLPLVDPRVAAPPTPKPKKDLTVIDVLIILRNAAGGGLIGSAVGGLLGWGLQTSIPLTEICAGIFAAMAIFIGMKSSQSQ